MTLCIISHGLQSPTGTDASMSIANVLGGISRISRSKHMVDKELRPIPLGIAGYFKPTLPNSARIKNLLLAAIEESLHVLKDLPKAPKTIRLLVGLPTARPGLDEDLESGLKQAIEEFYPTDSLHLDPEFIRRDHDSGIVGLEKVEGLCIENPDQPVLVAGVDSFVSRETIHWMVRSNVIYCSDNKRGYTPGEAASCCLVCSEQAAETYRFSVKAKIVRMATVFEPSKIDTNLVNAGKGLSGALTSVLESLPENETVQEVFCTLKGIREESTEFAFSTMSVGHRLEKPGEYTSLCQRWGDIGAASGPALIIYAVEKRELEFSESGYNLVFTISPGQSRSAALIKID
jgi:3-oxoacyl-[acyl-carrier-protein] synthase I